MGNEFLSKYHTHTIRINSVYPSIRPSVWCLLAHKESAPSPRQRETSLCLDTLKFRLKSKGIKQVRLELNYSVDQPDPSENPSLPTSPTTFEAYHPPPPPFKLLFYFIATPAAVVDTAEKSISFRVGTKFCSDQEMLDAYSRNFLDIIPQKNCYPFDSEELHVHNYIYSYLYKSL